VISWEREKKRERERERERENFHDNRYISYFLILLYTYMKKYIWKIWIE